jgi:hypothetical protein
LGKSERKFSGAIIVTSSASSVFDVSSKRINPVIFLTEEVVRIKQVVILGSIFVLYGVKKDKFHASL